MDATVTAMIIAVVGVLGTLFAPMISHRLTTRERAQEAQAAQTQQKFEELRAHYTAMNRAARQFHTLLKDALHRIRDGVFGEHERSQLEAARLDHRDRYAEAQMIVPQRIMQASREVNSVLAHGDATTKRLDRGVARPDENVEAALHALKAAEPLLAHMRALMRADLGLND
ncbi:hypothetical protein [Streptomyces lasiicapitis]|uniref:hypothetical protein n=1 Tax=Streptomyces lasiicapitis TaxID=1923961 RepID=UPI00364B6ED5